MLQEVHQVLWPRHGLIHPHNQRKGRRGGAKMAVRASVGLSWAYSCDDWTTSSHKFCLVTCSEVRFTCCGEFSKLNTRPRVNSQVLFLITPLCLLKCKSSSVLALISPYEGDCAYAATNSSLVGGINITKANDMRSTQNNVYTNEREVTVSSIAYWSIYIWPTLFCRYSMQWFVGTHFVPFRWNCCKAEAVNFFQYTIE